MKLASEVVETDGPVWIQIAREGTWEGHPKGPFEFDTKTFAEIIKNFRAHPSYHQGPDGLGDARVVPFDYEHASEMPPTSGTVPLTGAPAPAWALDLQIRAGEQGAELWAWTELSDQARQQIRSGGYQWTSVSVWPNAIDPVTGDTIGPVLTSVAFTNHPFIQGMAPMQASVQVYGKAETADEVIVGLRDILGLPADAAPAQVLAELEDLRAAITEGRTGPGFPDGGGYLVDCIRRLLGLRVLATTDEIVGSAGQAIATLSTSSASGPTTQENTMSGTNLTLTANIAALLNVKAQDETILAAVQKGKEAVDTLDKLLDLFGSSDMQALLGDAAKMIEKAKKAEGYLQALNAANEQLAVIDKEKAEGEVEQIAASMGLTGETASRFKPLLLKERLACNDPDPKVRQQKLEAFYKQYPLPSPQTQLLSQPIVAGPNGLQLGGAHTGYVTGNVPPVAPAMPVGNQAPEHLRLLAAYPGRNEIEKAIAYHNEKTPGFKLQPFQIQCRAAGHYVRTGQLPALS